MALRYVTSRVGSGSWRFVSIHPKRYQSVQAAQSVIDQEWESARPYESIPGPSFMDLMKGFRREENKSDMPVLALFNQFRKDYGDLVRMKGILGKPDIVLSFNPHDYEKVFRTEGTWPVRRGLDTFTYYRQKVRPDVFGESGGLANEQGEKWQQMRTITNPVMMNPKTVALYVDQVDAIAHEFLAVVDGLRDAKNELPADFDQWLNRWALETMGLLALDTRFGVLRSNQSAEAQTIISLVRDIFELTFCLDIEPSIWKYYKTSTFHRLMKVFDDLTNLIMVKIDEAVVRIEKNPKTEGNLSVLEKLLKVNKNAALVMSFDMIMAGIDTTSSTTVGVLYCLAKNLDALITPRVYVERVCGMLKITFNALRSRPNGAPVWGQFRSRSTQAQPASVAAEQIARDPEWDSARPYDDIPSPTLLGFLKEFGPFGKYKDATLYDINCRMRELYGPIMRMKGAFGREDIVLSFNPEDFEKVFRTEGVWPRRTGMDAFVYYRKQQRPEYFKGYGGLLAEQGEAWHKMRTIVNPIMMQPKIIKLYIDKVDEVAREFIGIVDGLRDDKQELPADFNEWLNRWALETMGVLVLDTRLGVLNREQTPEVKKLVQLTKDAMSLFFHLDIMPSMWRKIKTPGFYRLMRTLDELYHMVASKIDEAVVRMEKNPCASSDTLSILEKLLKVDRNAAFTMSLDSLFAGVDTTSSGSTGILYCLAHNPEKQDKLREELRKILPDKNSHLTSENMKNMPYLRACIKEGLRMYPPTTGNGRCVGKDLVIQGYRIPKGTMVAMGQLVLQRQEGQFTRPSEYLPERWLTGPEAAGCPSAKEAHPFVYMPFGFGARTCIGRRLAMMELEILVSRLIRQYHIRWNYGEIKYRASVVNVPSTDLKFELRDVRE